MKSVFDPYFVLYSLVWTSIHTGRFFHHPIPLLNDHLTDFIAIPVMAHLALVFTRRFIVRDPDYKYPLSFLLFMALFVSVVFEWIMPRLSPAYTADWWDVVAYFEGGIFYYRFHKSGEVYIDGEGERY
jgi:hypothetical protein